MDGLAAQMLALITGIGALVFVYAHGYLDHEPRRDRLLAMVGALTTAWAAVLALRERDLKRILARTTVSALGILVLRVGLPSPGAGLAMAAAFLFATPSTRRPC